MGLRRPPRFKTDEEWRDYLRAYGRAYMRGKRAQQAKAVASGIDPSCGQIGRRVIDAPPDVIAEAERAHALGHATLTAEQMGDPLPGRSALDKVHSGTRSG